MAKKVQDLTTEEARDILEVVPEFSMLSEKLDDRELDQALVYIAKLLEAPDINVNAAQYAIVNLEALAGKFAIASLWYKTYGKGGVEERYKKDAYYTARDTCRQLVDSLKYIIRVAERAN